MARPCIDCGLITRGTRCPPCAKQRNREKMTQRGDRYGRSYQADRAPLIGKPCEIRLPGCTGIADTADHYEGGLRPACGHCNFSLAGRTRDA